MAQVDITGVQHYVGGIGHPKTDVQSSGPAFNLPTVVPQTNDYAGIIAAVNACVAAGGGTVQLLPVTYNIGGNTLPLYDGVVYNGAGWVSGVQTLGGGPFLEQGTVIKGNNTAPGFSAKTTTLGAFDNVFIRNCGIRNLMISGFTRGIWCGTTNSGGLMYSTLENLKIIKCSDWGMFLVHTEACTIRQIKIHGCLNSYHHGNDSTWNGGDSTVQDVYVEPAADLSGSGSFGTKKSRSIWLNCRVGALNGLSLYQCGSNGPFQAGAISVAGTASSGVADIACSDTSNFEVGMPVVLTVAVTPFTANKIYFVKSYVANTSVQLTDGDFTDVLTNINSRAATLPTAGGSVTIASQGFAGIQASTMAVGAQGITGLHITNCNTEGAGTAKYFIQGGAAVTLVGGEPNNATFNSPNLYAVCIRNTSDIRVELSKGGFIDSDSMWVGNYGGSSGLISSPYSGNSGYGIGVRLNSGHAGMLMLHDQGIIPAIKIDPSTVCMYMGYGMLFAATQYSTGQSLNMANGNAMTFVTAAGGTLSLPVAAVNYLGLPIFINNPNAGTCTVSTQSSQTINGLGASVTSVAMGANTSMMLICQVTGSTYYWARYA
jgi:hypothetical protein